MNPGLSSELAGGNCPWLECRAVLRPTLPVVNAARSFFPILINTRSYSQLASKDGC